MALGDEYIARLGELTKEEADKAAISIVQLDRNGKIQLFNRCESRMSGCDPNAVVGLNFFTEVAACLKNDHGWGRFKSGVEANNLDTTISTSLCYRMRPTNVQLRMYNHAPTSTYWVFIAKQ